MDNLKEKERIEAECSAELMGLYEYLRKMIGKFPTRGIIIDRPILRHCLARIEGSFESMSADMHLLSYLDWRINMDKEENGNG